MRKALTTLIVALVASLALCASASASAFVVDSLDDGGDDNALAPECDADGSPGLPYKCTLRAAIDQARNDGNVNSITFSVTGTHVLTDGPLQPGGGTSLTITGNPGTTVDGNAGICAAPVCSVFVIGGLQPITGVVLEDLVIRNGRVTGGNGGGGINSAATTLTLNRVTVTGNTGDSFATGAGIQTPSSANGLVLNDSTVSGNILTNGGSGGGILAGGSLTLNRSTVSGNKADQTGSGQGGGIWLQGNGTIANSTISDNQAGTGNGGGIAFDANGNSLSLVNSTVAGNSADNGGGIRTNGVALAMSARNTILAQNTAASSGNNCSFNTGGFTSSQNSIDSDTSCGLGAVNGNKPNVSPSALVLGPLANNGGFTQTRALGIGSAALNAGDITTCTLAPVLGTDQRGQPRPQGPGCDIGAWEGNPLDLIAPNTLISKGPKKRTPKAKAKFFFSSTEGGSRFLCKVDKKSFAACTSPKTFKVKRGKHTVQIQAIDAAGNADATPARFKWRRTP